MKVLVTGGGGYIGSTLVRLLLDKGYGVVVLDRLFFGEKPLEDVKNEIKIIKDDIRWFDPYILSEIHSVFDLAALSNDPLGEMDPSKTMEINYKGRVRVAKLAKKYGVERYVLASSCSVYGFQDILLNEKSVVNPLTTYARANYLAERNVLPLGDKHFTVTALRQATVYGVSYRMRFDLVLNAMVKALYITGKLKIMRNGNQWRPLVHVKDTSRAFIEVMEADQEVVNREIFNVGSNEQNVQIFNLARRIAEACGTEFNYEWYGDPDKRSYKVSFEKIRTRLNFRPEFTIEYGAKEVWNALEEGKIDPYDPKSITVKWYKHLLENRDAYKHLLIHGKIL